MGFDDPTQRKCHYGFGERFLLFSHVFIVVIKSKVTQLTLLLGT